MIRVLFAGLLEASTQAYGFSWKMSTILWSVRFCLHPCCYTWLSSCRPSCGHLGFVTTFDTLPNLTYPFIFWDYLQQTQLGLFVRNTLGEELHVVRQKQRSGKVSRSDGETQSRHHCNYTSPPTPSPFPICDCFTTTFLPFGENVVA